MRKTSCFVLLLLALGCVAGASAQEEIKPSQTGVQSEYDAPNLIIRPAKMEGAPILLWMPGTSGEPSYAVPFLRAIAAQGYRVIGIEYNDKPAVNQVCPRQDDPECSAKFRSMRIWGPSADSKWSLVTNTLQESISFRLAALLKELQKRHPKEGWDEYLTAEGEPKWSRIAVAGQSQGAGMAAYIAKKVEVPRVVLFSSPIDSLHGLRNIQLAPWLLWKSATPMDRWYAERNAREPFNPGLIISYPAMGVPADHIRVFSLELPPGKKATTPMVYHGINLHDTRYLPEWKFLFGNMNTK